MILFDDLVYESMLTLDGGPLSELPDGSGGPIVAGPEAVFIGTRIDVDSPTRLVVASGVHGLGPRLVEGYRGIVATPGKLLRVVNVFGREYFTLQVSGDSVNVQILLSDFDEPDVVVVVVNLPIEESE